VVTVVIRRNETAVVAAARRGLCRIAEVLLVAAGIGEAVEAAAVARNEGINASRDGETFTGAKQRHFIHAHLPPNANINPKIISAKSSKYQ